MRFVVSMRLGRRPTEPVLRWLELDPTLEFKLDPTSGWTDELVEEAAATGAVESADLKGAYKGTVVDQPPTRALRARRQRAPGGVARGSGADPGDRARARSPPRAGHLGRADPHREPSRDCRSRPDAEREAVALRLDPRPLRALRLLRGARDRLYGGGQFELGPGRGQIQYLASLFHPDGPNDVAPGAYNEPVPAAGLPGSPLEPAPDTLGFRWSRGLHRLERVAELLEPDPARCSSLTESKLWRREKLRVISASVPSSSCPSISSRSPE